MIKDIYKLSRHNNNHIDIDFTANIINDIDKRMKSINKDINTKE